MVNPFSLVAQGIRALGEHFANVLLKLDSTSDSFILKDVVNFLGYINPFSDNFILNGVLDFLGNILSYINPFSENFLLKGVLNFLSDMLSYINPFSDNFLGKKLVELLGNLLKLLFIPSEDSINNLTNSVSSKFGFIDSIKLGIESVKNIINNVGSSPKLVINIDSSYYKGELTVVDLNWYKPYKAYGDLILTGFIYVIYLWRLFVTLPSVISGAGGIVHDGLVIERTMSKEDRRI